MILKNYERKRAMNKNIFQIISMISLLVGIELVQASSDQISGYDRYKQFIDYAEQQGRDSAERLKKLKQLHEPKKLSNDVGVLSQEMNNETPGGILEFIKRQYPQYLESFKLLDAGEKGLYNFIQQQLQNAPRDEDGNISEDYTQNILQAIEDNIAHDMESTFITGLQRHNPKFIFNLDITKIKKMADLSPQAPLKYLENDKNPIIQYAMKYKDGWMKNIIDEWIRNWIINYHDNNGNNLLLRAIPTYLPEL